MTADIAALASAEALVKTRTAGTVETRDGKRTVVIADMHSLHGYVQQVASANAAQAEEIAAAAAMTFKKAGVAQQDGPHRQAGGLGDGEDRRQGHERRPLVRVAAKHGRRQDVERLASDRASEHDGHRVLPGHSRAVPPPGCPQDRPR